MNDGFFIRFFLSRFSLKTQLLIFSRAFCKVYHDRVHITGTYCNMQINLFTLIVAVFATIPNGKKAEKAQRNPPSLHPFLCKETPGRDSGGIGRFAISGSESELSAVLVSLDFSHLKCIMNALGMHFTFWFLGNWKISRAPNNK